MRALIIMFSVGFLFIAFSCSAPESNTLSMQNRTSPPRNYPIPYHNYADLCHSTWESQDKKVRVVFKETEKNVSLFYEEQSYNFATFSCQEGIFYMESSVFTKGHDFWTLNLVMRPDSKNMAWFDLTGGDIKTTGILKRID